MDKGIWTAFEAAAATGGILCARGGIDEGGSPDMELPEESWTAGGLSIDTRTIAPGDMFVALSDTRDGHDFVEAAFAAGASVALVSKAPPDLPDGAPLLMVHDTLDGISQLAGAARDRCFGKLIAVTGSAGKTGTKEMLRTALAPSGHVHAADKSFNNHLGVPLTLAQLPPEADFGVFEIGMNHAGEITPLSRLVRPHLAIVTTVAAAHLANFENIEAIARAKAEIFAGVRPGGAAILPRDNAHFDSLADAAHRAGIETVISFGTHAQADIRLVSYEGGCPAVARVKTGAQYRTLQLNIPGEHQAHNALAVIAALGWLRADLEAGCAAFAQMSPVIGRGSRYQLALGERVIEIIDESYNANPASMEAAIKVLGAATPGGSPPPVRAPDAAPADTHPSDIGLSDIGLSDTGLSDTGSSDTGGPDMTAPCRRIAILGEMRELGPAAPGLHADLADTLIMANITRVYAAGGLMRHLFESLPHSMRGCWAENAVDLAENLTKELKNGDIVMAKGSNTSRIDHLLARLKGDTQCDGDTRCAGNPLRVLNGDT